MSSLKKEGFDQRKEHIPPETVSFFRTFKEGLSSLSTFFGAAYTVLIIISVTYNLGYFKNINPQFIELMGIGDYINDTLDNLWFFIIFISLIFSSSLGAAKEQDDPEFPLVLLAALSILSLTLYVMFKGGLENKFFYIIGRIAPYPFIFYILIGIFLAFIILLSILLYRFFYKFVRQPISKYTPAIGCISLFSCVVVIPYVLGIFKCSYEKELITKGEIKKYAVDILTTNKDQILKDLYIVKELDKGVIVRQYIAGTDSNESKFIFIHWNDVKRIYYKEI